MIVMPLIGALVAQHGAEALDRLERRDGVGETRPSRTPSDAEIQHITN